jgi:hypothetical protein
VILDWEHRLYWVRRPVDWDGYDLVDDGHGLRIVYAQAGTASGPGAAIAEVLVLEGFDRVAVTLVARHLVGTYPDGLKTSENLMKVTSFMEVRLMDPLDDRELIDGATGKRPPRLDRDAPEDSRDGRILRAMDGRGCPVWLP